MNGELSHIKSDQLEKKPSHLWAGLSGTREHSSPQPEDRGRRWDAVTWSSGMPRSWLSGCRQVEPVVRLERLAGGCAAILHLRVRYLPDAVLWPPRGLVRTAREPCAVSRARTWHCGPPRLGGLGPQRSASRSAPPAAHWPAAGDAPEEEPGRAGRGSPGAQPWAIGRRPTGSPASRTAWGVWGVCPRPELLQSRLTLRPGSGDVLRSLFTPRSCCCSGSQKRDLPDSQHPHSAHFLRFIYLLFISRISCSPS